MTSDELQSELRQRLSGRGHEKILRFALNLVSSLPFVGGVFSAAAALWSEHGQATINSLVERLVCLTDDKVTESERRLVSASDRNRVIAAYVTFNPNSGELLDASGISSLSDNGALDFSVTLGRPGDYLFYGGAGPVKIEHLSQSENGVRVRFAAPAPEWVRLAFFDLGATS